MVSALLDQLAADLAAVSFVKGTETAEDDAALLLRARRVLEVKLRLEMRRSLDSPPLVVIAGGTNAGKSTVFNWLVGDQVASSSPLARHTKSPTVFVHSSEVNALCKDAFLPGYRRTTLHDAADATREPEEGVSTYFVKTHDEEDLKGLVLVDSPDIDSTHVKNRMVAEDLLFLADAVVFVTTPEKYNDELCVRYMRQASELAKALVCVLNKGADVEVIRDFRELVLPGLAREVAVLTLPYVNPRPEPRTSEPYRAELKRAVLRSCDAGAELRREVIRGTCVWLGGELERITARLKEEALELASVSSKIHDILDQYEAEYREFLATLEFYELDDVFLRVLQHFRIPVIDDVYDRFRSLGGLVWGAVASVAGAGSGPSQRELKLRDRSEKDRQTLKELIEAARSDVNAVPFSHTQLLRPVASTWIEGMKAVLVDERNQDVEDFHVAAEAMAQAWIEREERRQIELLQSHPYAKKLLHTIKGGLQIGLGLLSAKLTAGFGPWDALISAAAERATKELLEHAGGVVHYQSLKTEFTETRAHLFRDLLQRVVAQPLLSHLPTGVDSDRLERLEGVALSLRKGEALA